MSEQEQNTVEGLMGTGFTITSLSDKDEGGKGTKPKSLVHQLLLFNF